MRKVGQSMRDIENEAGPALRSFDGQAQKVVPPQTWGWGDQSVRGAVSTGLCKTDLKAGHSLARRERPLVWPLFSNKPQ